MRYYHKHSFFPLVITLLTLGLILFMFYSLTYEGDEEVVLYPEEIVFVDVDQYQADLVFTLADFGDAYGASQDDLARLVAAEKALDQLLDMSVPSEYKELHLELAVVFSQLQSGLRSAERSVDEPLARLDQLNVQYPWLSE